MALSLGLIPGLALFWCMLFIFDNLLKRSKWSECYDNFLRRYGITISLAQIRVTTTRLNRTFVQIGCYCTYLWKIWFTTGLCCGLVIMASSIFILTITAVRSLLPKKHTELLLTPVLPGINIGWSQLVYVIPAIAISGIFHELGHAIAAIRENVKVNGFGLFVMLIYPGAYVDLSSDHLSQISPYRQLKIYCAGAWHNIVLALLCIVLVKNLSIVLWPFYVTGGSIAVLNVFSGSPLYNVLERGDIITNINECPVQSISLWRSCLSDIQQQPLTGYCVDIRTLEKRYHHTVKGPIFDCCNRTSSDLCFSFKSMHMQKRSKVCLNARNTSTRSSCNTDLDCLTSQKSTCVIPVLPKDYRLLRIKRNRKKDVLYIDIPKNLLQAVSITNYLPRLSSLSVMIPDNVERFLLYIISFSAALALLNLVPAYALDGQWVLIALTDYFTTPSNRRTVNRLRSIIHIIGTGLLVLNVAIALRPLII
ncbi:Membrane-bound transcription factor site-2 protease [Trichoplax sp. H2]|nr:Membrane-bound transcription factor site-2 protease [Trichoplax sp. H2]|eukprot:RDD45892.1 Membrane-bound transcription factor site-2 protease [Trichoplax sp. H2]